MLRLLEAAALRPAHMLSILVLTVVGIWGLSAQAQTLTEGAAKPGLEYTVLLGRWVRLDGGYVITITGAEADGKLDAAYANPSPLPFSKAEASRDGDIIKLSFELRAGGYNGSNYNLIYDPVEDVLRGVYYQALAQKKYAIQFQRLE